MRFIESGPDIPDSLISARDEGRVVFFCGAGVSIPAGFPSFLKLTLQVMKSLGVSVYSESPLSVYLESIEFACSEKCPVDFKLPFSFDQVFYLLQQEYGLDAVECEVSLALSVKKSPILENHKVILRLAKNSNQHPQVVTTNFDLLFEQAQRTVRTHIQPALPDLTSGLPPEGVIYLHGRLNGRGRGLSKSRLIISSADFGRAYLADGWANRFIKELAQQYIIVLLGYSAEDPPVRYLLEGMHSKNSSTGGAIYAFDRGSQEHVDQNWRHRGVSGIAFNNFDDLWGSLNAWADYSENPATWRASALKLAAKSPRELSAFERGQVAHLISSASGAELFYNAEPSPSAEWLCVFDPKVRNAKPEVVRDFMKPRRPEYVAQELYGLEGDPQVDYDSHDFQYWGVDYISLLPGESGLKNKREQGLVGDIKENLPARMKYLAAWLTNKIDDPWALWWAAGKVGLNATVVSLIEYRLWKDADKLSEHVVSHWNVLLDECKYNFSADDDISWYQFKDKVTKVGWGSLTLSCLERAIRPRLKITRRFRYPNLISSGESVVTELDLVFISLHGENLDIPSDILPQVLLIWREAIVRAGRLVADLPYFPLVDLFSEKEHYVAEEVANAIVYFSKLFAQLVLAQPLKAKKEFDSWPDESLFFYQLRLFAMLCPGLLKAEEVFLNIDKFSDEDFWSQSCRIKIIELLVFNWQEFSQRQRRQIERRIIAGPPIKYQDAPEQSKLYNAYSVGEMLGGLDRRGCELSGRALGHVALFRSSYDNSERIESGAFRRVAGQTGWVATDKSASVLLMCPIGDVTSLAQLKAGLDVTNFTQAQPFVGLVRVAPLRAFKSLVLDAKKNKYIIELWEQLLREWPNSSVRLTIQVARRLILLPADVVAQISQVYSEWMLRNYESIHAVSADFALFLWDNTLTLLKAGGAKSLKSSILSIRRAGKEIARSAHDSDRAINSPIGRMTDVLFTIYGRQKYKAGCGLQSELKIRIERLLSLRTVFVWHAVNRVALRLDWLFWIEPEWTKKHILPLFHVSSKNADAAWNGRLFNSRHFSPELFEELKMDFVDLFRHVPDWCWARGLSRILHQHLILACRHGVNDNRYLNFEEVRWALQITNDAGRADALRYLATLMVSKSIWGKFGRVFLAKVWPRELRYLTHTTSNSFLYLIEKVPGSFPEVVRFVVPFLTTVKRCDVLFYSSTKKPDDSHATLHPDAMLLLLDKILADDSIPPYQFHDILNQIVQSKPSLARDRRLLRLRKIAMEHT